MDNYVNVTHITLGGHVQLLEYRYLYFIITLVLFILIVCGNTFVIFVICTHKSLHKPMYIFIGALLLNNLFGSMALYPKLLTDLLSVKQVISLPACIVQSFMVYLYAAIEFTLLSVMAYDRYVSICKPLQYHTLIRKQTIKILLLLAWLWPTCEIGGSTVLTVRLKLCKFVIMRIFCDNFSIVKISCGDTRASNVYGLTMLVIMIFPPGIFIIFSYTRILLISQRGSRAFKRKALRTCLPHLLVFINFTVISLFEVIHNRFLSDIPHVIRMMLSTMYLVIPPVFNPLIYGLKMPEISKRLKVLVRVRLMA